MSTLDVIRVQNFSYSQAIAINWTKIMMRMNKDVLVIILSICLLQLLFACSHAPKQTDPKLNNSTRTETPKNTLGKQIASLAKTQVGAPYRYGGASPRGYDCSGLVFYAHGKFGISTPRTSSAQFNSARPIKLSQLESGDVVFFRINRKKISHVGIYVGKGKFVHAPSSGKLVTTNHLNEPYWKTRIVGAGRLY